MKFLQSLDKKIFNQLTALSKKRGITVQEYVRAIIIPTYLEHTIPVNNKRSLAMKKGWETRRQKQQEALELSAKNAVADTGAGAFPVE